MLYYEIELIKQTYRPKGVNRLKLTYSWPVLPTWYVTTEENKQITGEITNG